MCMLLSSTVMVLHSLILDVLKSACHFQAKVWKDVTQNASASVNQELMMAPLPFLALVNHVKVKEAWKTGLQIVEVVT